MAALLLIALSYRKPRALVLCAALLLGSLTMSIREASLQSSAINKYTGQHVALVLQVSTDPIKRPKKVMGRNFTDVTFSFIAQAREVGHRYTLKVPVRVIASSYSVRNLLPGQKIEVNGAVLKSKERRVAALVIVKSKVRVLTQPSRWARAMGAIRSGLRNSTGSGDSGALIPGMVIGDTSKQSETFKNDMRRSGLTHLVAVSGANFAIVSTFILWSMQYFFRRVNFRLLATSLILIAFISLVRPSPSVLRAAAMAAVALVAQSSRRARDSLPALGFAIAAVVVADPWQARDPGFALSVLATAGLLLLAPLIEKRLPKKIGPVLAPPIAAMVMCAPVIISLSGYIGPMSIVANVLAAPAVAPITVVGFTAALISPFSPFLAQLLVLPVKPLAAYIAAVAHWCAQFSVISIRTGLMGFLLALAVVAAIAIGGKKVGVALLVLVITALWFQRFPAGEWDIANCDIGQGDSMVINLRHHRAIVIDVGPDPLTEDKCLRQLGVKTIPLLILTHPHADHIGGLAGARKHRRITTTWFGNINAGTHAKIDDISIDVLWPRGVVDENPNNNSIATIITTQNYRLFAAGDIEPPVQERLIGQIGHVDIYKVAHHGSRYQYLPLMRELSPTLAVISVGTGNTYGHPAASTIAALRQLGAKVVRTDRDGAIAINAERHRLKIQREKAHLRLFGWG